MLNFGASKPRVKGAPGPPPGSAPALCAHMFNFGLRNRVRTKNACSVHSVRSSEG